MGGVPYRIDITNSAKRAIRRLDRQTQVRVDAVIRSLADDPRPQGAEKLAGAADEYRVRLGGWRVLYRIIDAVLVVVVVDVGGRGQIYKRRQRRR